MLLRTNHSFRHLFVSRLFALLADSILFFTLLKWIELNASPNEPFTLFYVAFYLPITLLALPIGAWISNKTLQRVMIASDALRVITIVLFVPLMQYIAYEWSYALLTLISILGLFFVPANQALLPYLVTEEQRPKANSLIQMGYTVAKITGQIATAALIKLSLPLPLLLLLSAILLLCSLQFVRRIKPLIRHQSHKQQSQWMLTKEGFRYIAKHPQLRTLFTFLAIATFIASAVDLVLLSLLTDVLHIGVENLNYIGTASLLGIMTGAFLAPRWYNRREKMWLLILPLFGLSISLGSLYFINHLLYILPIFCIQGIALGCFNVTLITFLQEIIEDEQYTRTFSLYHMITSCMALPGVIVIGSLLSYTGVKATILIMTGILLLIGTLAILVIPKLQPKSTPSPVMEM